MDYEDFEKALPPPVTEVEIEAEWRLAAAELPGKIVVLDDDPTGTQTVHGVPVYTRWDSATLSRMMTESSRVVYLLTNSRSLTEAESSHLHRQVAHGLKAAADGGRKPFLLVSRSDSTLRGHYPLETDTLREALRPEIDFDAEILIPFFAEGGRITAGDRHYVREGRQLVPVGRSEFARDSTFGFRSSDLKAWVAEKTDGECPASSVLSIPLELLRTGRTDEVIRRLTGLQGFGRVVVNATVESDLKVFLVALAAALKGGRRFIFRTAASFVKVAAGMDTRPLLGAADLFPDGVPPGPGLVVAGSHVPRTTRQLQVLRSLPNMTFVEWNVRAAQEAERARRQSHSARRDVQAAFEAGRHVCLYTSRQLHRVSAGSAGEHDLLFARRVSRGLVDVVCRLDQAPGFLVAKGGITSSDLLTAGLGVVRAEVAGQVHPGVPLWRLGAESRFPGMPFVVFPGNVGTDDALAAVLRKMAGTGC